MENEIKKTSFNGLSKGLGFGLFLILIGTLMLGFNSGALPHELKRIVFSWQMLLIFIGAVNVYKRHMVSGVVLILTGTFFIIPRIVHQFPTVFPGLNENFTAIYWPLLLIFGGLFLILSRTLAPKWWNTEFFRHGHNHGQYYKSKHTDENWYKKNRDANPNSFSKNSIFGSGQHIVLDPVFNGGDINAVFGGVTLDLRKTSLPEGITYLEINAVFGGVTLYVPHEWLVEMNLDSVFGGFEDKRMFSDNIDTTKKLVVVGACVFGGGELRN